jgi:hypothetical protein
MDKSMDHDKVAAAILAAGFATAQRQPLSGGLLEDSLKEKYVEFLAFIREQDAAAVAAMAPWVENKTSHSKTLGKSKRKK